MPKLKSAAIPIKNRDVNSKSFQFFSDIAKKKQIYMLSLNRAREEYGNSIF